MGLASIAIQKESKGTVLILRMKGRLDTLTSPSAEHEVFDYINLGQHHILMNFNDVDYLSSAGMRMLLSVAKKLKTLQGKLVISNLNEKVFEVLKLAGFDHVLNIALTEDEAFKLF